jgi:sulfatase maturation enzyme AslB (radical SAM superfamily)
MCPRRINGGILNPLINEIDISLDIFQEWFPVNFLKQLDSLFLCGNLGDPIIAQDCLEVIQYIKAVNPNIRLSMHTNGSARTTQWWEQLAYTGTRVVFGIDGLTNTHSLYRIGTSFDKIIENASAFIQAGGQAEWHMLVFDHNKHQTGACQHMADQMGFKKFISKHTSRFKNDKFHVLDELGRTTHILHPTERSKSMVERVIDNYNSVTIDCKAKKWKQIYISANGNVSPCCWLDFSWQLPSQENRIEYCDLIGSSLNLHQITLEEIFNSGYFSDIEQTPLIECKKQCGKFDKLQEQFNEN